MSKEDAAALINRCIDAGRHICDLTDINHAHKVARELIDVGNAAARSLFQKGDVDAT